MGNQSPTTRFIEMVPPLLVLAGAIALLQVHAIQFWTEFVGPMGWAWAVLLEVVALWLWYQRQLARRMLAMVASVLTLTGPIYMVCEPLVDEWLSASHVDASRELRIERLALEASRLEESIEAFRANSEARAGWLEPIQVAQARLAEVDSQLATLVAAPPAEACTWRQQALIGMQAVALLIFQLAAVLAITSLSKLRQHAFAKGVTPRPTSSCDRLREETPGIGQNLVVAGALNAESATCNLEPELGLPSMGEANNDSELGKGGFAYADIVVLRDAREQLLEDREMTQAAFCRDHDFSPRDLSLLRRHEARCAAGARTISITALDRLAEILRHHPTSCAA